MIDGVEDLKSKYGIPEEKKFPLDTKEHVISAIKFFNYAKPKYRQDLANAIMVKVKEYGIKLTPTTDNDFYKYIEVDELSHSYKGTEWKKHKYISKDGNRYVYATSVNKLGEKLSEHKAKKQEEKQRMDENAKKFHQEISSSVDNFLQQFRIMKIWDTPFSQLPELFKEFSEEDRLSREEFDKDLNFEKLMQTVLVSRKR